MEIEVKKDKLGGTICSLKDGERQGVSFRLEDFFKEIDYDFSDYSFEYDLASLGFRYAQLAIESDNLEENLSAYRGDLFLIETLLKAFSKSLSRIGFFDQMKNLKNQYETELSSVNKEKKELSEAFLDARNKIDEYLSKNINLQNENEALKDSIICLKQKIKDLEGDDKIS